MEYIQRSIAYFIELFGIRINVVKFHNFINELGCINEVKCDQLHQNREKDVEIGRRGQINKHNVTRDL